MRDNLEWSCRGAADRCACGRRTLFPTVPGVQFMRVEEKYKSRKRIHANKSSLYSNHRCVLGL